MIFLPTLVLDVVTELYLGIANFIVGLAFLPLRNKLSGGDATKEGRVFYLFAGVLFLFSSIFFRSYGART
jgi:hypothetical protein